MDLNPRRLLVLSAIAQSGGLTPAVRVLGHTRSAVSEQLASLEREVGLPLVDRSGTRLELTAAGRLLAATGERISKELVLAVQQLGSVNQQVIQGPVAIWATSWLLARIAVRALRLLARSHPQVEPRFVEAGHTLVPDPSPHPVPRVDSTACTQVSGSRRGHGGGTGARRQGPFCQLAWADSVASGEGEGRHHDTQPWRRGPRPPARCRGVRRRRPVLRERAAANGPASARLRHRCQPSATWRACGAPVRAPSA
ncbi:LysR family transcriptional regulator [Streptomyces sp. NPDC007896]|uniref:LysR family transcriptional regulator n=1 Tax=unclassified Streptomyces TaxID=2593676 RepID=UPI0036ED9206